MDFFKTKEAKIKIIQAKFKNKSLPLWKKLILMVQLMILGFGNTDK